jgi:hypothetical protein
MDQAIKHCTAGIGIWPWASNDQGGEPDVVMACCGDVPTLETLAAVDLIRRHLPELKIRVINVVDLMKLQPQSEHPHGLSDQDFDVLFLRTGPSSRLPRLPHLIHRLTYRRTNHKNIHVRGGSSEGTTTTPFDMCVLNRSTASTWWGRHRQRAHPGPGGLLQAGVHDAPIQHRQYVTEHGEDRPAISGWQGPAGRGARRAAPPRPITSEIWGVAHPRGASPCTAGTPAPPAGRRFGHDRRHQGARIMWRSEQSDGGAVCSRAGRRGGVNVGGLALLRQGHLQGPKKPQRAASPGKR